MLLTLLGVGVLVALAILSLGTLLSIFLAAVVALGLDPIVGALVKRGWKRGRGVARRVRRAVRVGLRARARHRRARVGPDHGVRPVAAGLLGRACSSRTGSRASPAPRNADDTIRNALKDLAAGLPEAASALLGIAGGVFGSVLSLVTLTFLALFLLMERPMITDWLFGFAPPEADSALAPGARGLDQRGLDVADRQHRDLGRGRHRGRRLGVDLRAAVPARAGRDHRPARPDPAGRGHDRRGDPRRSSR